MCSCVLFQGFPPKPINLTNDSENLSNLNFQSGDTLIVQEDAQAKNEAQIKETESFLQELEGQSAVGGYSQCHLEKDRRELFHTSINNFGTLINPDL